MKKSIFRQFIYSLFFLLFFQNIFVSSHYVFDLHQSEHLKIEQTSKSSHQKLLDSYPAFKNKLLQFFSTTLKKDQKEDDDQRPQFVTNASNNQKTDYQYFLKADKNRPVILVTITSKENGPIQSKCVAEVSIIALGKAVIGWIGSSIVEMATIEAAKIAAAKIGIGVAGTVVVGSAIKDQVDKSKNSGGGGGGNENDGKGNKNKISPEQKVQETKRVKELKENVQKFNTINALQKTNPVEAEKKAEELRTSLARAKAEEQRKKLINNYPKDMPNREQALMDAGLIKDTRPGYNLVNNSSQAVTNSSKTTVPQVSTATEVKTSNVTSQQFTNQQILTAAKPTFQGQVSGLKNTASLETSVKMQPSAQQTQISVQPKVLSVDSIKEAYNKQNTASSLSDLSLMHQRIKMPSFFSWQSSSASQESVKTETANDKNKAEADKDIVPDTLLKKKHETNSVLKQHLKNNSSSGSPIPPPDKDSDDEKKKEEKFKAKHPNGIYEENPKHHQNSKGNISKCPQDGQKALDNAIQVEGQNWKVSIEGDKFVIFEEHLPGKWHGYIIDNPAGLHQDIKNLLFKEGWIRSVNNFKIIKKI